MLNGLGGHDSIYGGDWGDEIKGGQGNDFLFGGKGKDAISGEIGNDIIDGGAGADQLFGERGADTFVFATSAQAQNDRIGDFEPGIDKIDFRGLASEVIAGSLHFTGMRSTRAAGNIFYEHRTPLLDTDHTLIRVNLDGGRFTELSIRLDGLHALGEADFLFA